MIENDDDLLVIWRGASADGPPDRSACLTEVECARLLTKEADDGERARAADHIGSCRECAEEYRLLQPLALWAAEVEQVLPSNSLTRAARSRRWRAWWVWPRLSLAAAGAAALLVGLAAPLYFLIESKRENVQLKTQLARDKRDLSSAQTSLAAAEDELRRRSPVQIAQQSSAVQQRLTELQTELAREKEEQSSTRTSLAEAQEELRRRPPAQTVAQSSAVQQRLTELQNQLAREKEELSSTRTSLAEAQEELRRRPPAQTVARPSAGGQLGLGGIGGTVSRVTTKLGDLKVTDAEERQIGQQVSDKLVDVFGVYQNVEVTRYVTLVGSVLARATRRPGLAWQFVVLDTDGVNAFAAPGGYIHITKGALGLMKNEAELAGVLAHEIIHVTDRHTVTAIQNSDGVSVLSGEAGSSGGLAPSLVARIAEKAYIDILNNRFSRNDENNADEKGAQLADEVGYAPAGLSSALTKLIDRNRDIKGPNGLFASQPTIKERLTNIEKTIRERKLAATATVQTRYTKYIALDPKPASGIATVARGEPGVNPDRDAVGGTNKNRVPVKIGPADIADFQKGITP